MSLRTILRALGVGILMIAAAHLAPILVALVREPAAKDAYLFSAAVSGLAGGGLYVIGGRRRRADDLREAILFICLWWVIAPLFAAAPFALTGATPAAAAFESLSALTTTGAWLSETAARESPAGVMWRATLQWVGGLATLAFAAAVLVRPLFVGIETVPPRFARREDNSYFTAMQTALGYLAPAYGALTAIGAIILAVAGFDALGSIATAMSLASSGGFLVDADALDAPSLAVAGALFPLLLVGGVNFALIAAVADNARPRRADSETAAYFLIVIALAAALWAFGAPTDGQAEGEPWRHILNAASLASTNAVVIGDVPNLALALIAVVIGGSAVSTAGGLKVLRWLVLFRRVREELARLVSPRAVFGRPFVEVELGVWMHFIAFTFVLAGLTVIGLAGGAEFDLAAAGAVGALANAGPALALVEGGEMGYGAFKNGAHLAALAGAMVLGRIEAIAALALFNLSFWRS
ncbi:MAG: hypothetical protein GC152_16110 [Alphaproteobacteria bacterium]|nr:hypothetical protein [Alphaproteobacteria bacterium]